MNRQPVIDDVIDSCLLKDGRVFISESDRADGFPQVNVLSLYGDSSPVELYTIVDFSGRHPYEEIIKGILALRRVENSLRESVPDCKVDSYLMLTNSPVKHWTELLSDHEFTTMYDHYFPYREVKRKSEPAAAIPRT